MAFLFSSSSYQALCFLPHARKVASMCLVFVSAKYGKGEGKNRKHERKAAELHTDVSVHLKRFS